MDLCAHPSLVQVMVVASVRVLREDAFDATSTRHVEDEHHNMSKQPFIGFGVYFCLVCFLLRPPMLNLNNHCLKLPQKFNHL